MINFDGDYDPEEQECEDELLLEGESLPLDSKRSCELAVECWNLRNSLIEANQSYNYTKKDLKMQKYVLRRVQNEMVNLQRALNAKDMIMKEKCVEAEILTRKIAEGAASRRCIISSMAKSEHCHKDILKNYSSLEVENCTMKSQLKEQERSWQERCTSMELILTLDAQQAEKERDELLVKNAEKDRKFIEFKIDILGLENIVSDLELKNASLEQTNLDLEDKCVWGLELEQAYETLHGRLEISSAEKEAATIRITQLEKERNRIQSFALSEGIELPFFSDANGDEY